MRISIHKKLALFAGVLGMFVLSGSSVFAATNIAKNGQDAANAKLDLKSQVAGAAPDCKFFSATNAAVQRRVYTNNTATNYTNTDWQNMQCGSFSVSVPRGKSALVVVKTDAEVSCTVATSDSQWCQGRVLIDNAEGMPNAPEPDSFSWANSQTDPSAWESNAFTRTAQVRCPADNKDALCTYMVRAQVKNHAPNMTFRVDDSTVDASVTYF